MFRVLVFSARPYDRQFLEAANRQPSYRLHFLETTLRTDTAALAAGYPAVCCFVDDELNAPVLGALYEGGTRLVLLRATGFNNVDLQAAHRLGITVMRVSHYSPEAVAEFAVGLLLTLNRRIHRAYNRVREGNFLLDNLLGMDLHGKTVGVVGTGQIGRAFARIMAGFGCRLLAHDPIADPECAALGVRYTDLTNLLQNADVISLHTPLTPQTHHLINAHTLAQMKPGALLINTSRGALIDTSALIEALKQRRIGAVALDVYEEESHLFFQNLSEQIIADDVFARLLSFPNVLVTGHQAFFTQEALTAIADTTIANIGDFLAERDSPNRLDPQQHLQVSQSAATE
ncbi:2-hydroxyacid dehydrogenase [Candidatus Macondimonas diazotrophica]|jgi:D-lactate dehydrogenase|uniref:2-hydroxyacid dehydrogenase n=1 Tax=Candidatus Macondimonas diazotrophica TaxID=2305248 RepID=A0A4Z0FC57_9GAMM|nr:2-hydroxyacid dehydrogenase [Candidatus Macondimonas diazotrophica]HBG30308.1 hydroxyacid dehydrogenase [Gammaproteobacteria bacterium]NCU01291.1 2-hydroxyacid dehydrogenase [Candidatus Macondimonas diazotrophica]TFZ83312.1 2-hydroxyacid dehydrogenase [Candidatus Macondimonas diazotrophica]HBG51678.1 hydroxyacid dehydrogenase [Gammaproteobacteria bacterium]HCO42545.1 hydroxyacid dehydrogenase [Gammaproteobacteria bacterium]